MFGLFTFSAWKPSTTVIKAKLGRENRSCLRKQNDFHREEKRTVENQITVKFIVQPENVGDGQRISNACRLEKNVIEMISAFLQKLFDRLHANVSEKTKSSREKKSEFSSVSLDPIRFTWQNNKDNRFEVRASLDIFRDSANSFRRSCSTAEDVP